MEQAQKKLTHNKHLDILLKSQLGKEGVSSEESAEATLQVGEETLLEWIEKGDDEKEHKLIQIVAENEELQARIIGEEDKRRQWKLENERRKHNYVPFIFDLLKCLAQKDMLKGMFEDAVAKKKEKKQKENEKKDAEMTAA